MDRNLTTEEVVKLHNEAGDRLVQELGIEIR